jgi:hypothetical protein
VALILLGLGWNFLFIGEIKWSDLVVKDARKLKSFIQYIKQNKILNNTVTTKTISQERIINDTLIEFLYRYWL